MKIADIQSNPRKLQIDLIENGNINSNHLNSSGLYLNGKMFCNSLKISLRVFENYDIKKVLLRQKKIRHYRFTIQTRFWNYMKLF